MKEDKTRRGRIIHEGLVPSSLNPDVVALCFRANSAVSLLIPSSTGRR